MWPLFQALLVVVSTVVRSRLSLQLEVIALRHQLSVYQRLDKRLNIRPGDPNPLVLVIPARVKVAYGPQICATLDGHCLAKRTIA